MLFTLHGEVLLGQNTVCRDRKKSQSQSPISDSVKHRPHVHIHTGPQQLFSERNTHDPTGVGTFPFNRYTDKFRPEENVLSQVQQRHHLLVPCVCLKTHKNIQSKLCFYPRKTDLICFCPTSEVNHSITLEKMVNKRRSKTRSGWLVQIKTSSRDFSAVVNRATTAILLQYISEMTNSISQREECSNITHSMALGIIVFVIITYSTPIEYVIIRTQ